MVSLNQWSWRLEDFFKRDSSQLRNFKTELQIILLNDDVQFFWALVSASWEEDESQTLLELVVKRYVTVRGFSFASGWMEKCKQANKMPLQKSKGLRKVLVPKDHHSAAVVDEDL